MLVNGINKKSLTIGLFIIEGVILVCLLIAFWYHIDPRLPLRDSWFWLLWLAIPVFHARFLLQGQLWTHTFFHNLILIFIIFAAFSYSNALYQRESYLAAMARPLFGIWLFVYFIEITKFTKSLKPVWIITLVMGLTIGGLALTTSDWLPEKSGELMFLIERLPEYDYRQAATQVEQQVCSPLIALVHSNNCYRPALLISNSLLRFNVNEIAGGLIWFAPVMLGLTLFVRPKEGEQDASQSIFWLVIRGIAGLSFVWLFLALLFGQSRFGILGLIASIGVLGWVAFPKSKWRYAVIGFAVAVLLLEVVMFFNVFGVPESEATGRTDAGQTFQTTSRDANSVSTRLAIWQSGIDMMLDHPFAGVGMYMYRTAVNSSTYEIPYYAENPNLFPPPHAHNMWITIGAEMGVIGLLIFVGWQITALWMIWVGWQSDNQIIRMTALAGFAGLLGHSIYGVGDTIALWDRLQFAQWWIYGLVGAQFVLAHSLEDTPISQTENETI